MEYPRPIATTNEGWIIEIIDAYKDAKAAIPFAEAAGKTISEADLFHMAPLVCLKFRDLLSSEESRTKAKDAAMGSYMANIEAGNRNMNDSVIAFSFCYMLAHYGLGLVDEEKCQSILALIETHLEKIKTAVAD